ncbi:hypothetical protein WA158_000708 [Blastocystis sp. Blastoise]
MVKENILFDTDKINILKEDINVFEELMKDIISVFSSLMNLDIKHIGNDYNETKPKVACDFSFCDDFSEENIKNNYMNKRKYHDECDDEKMDLIRFTNNGPIFRISKSVLDSLKGSFIEEQRDEELRTNDGSIFLDYPGNDAAAYILLDYLNGKKVNFTQFSYEQQLEILELFEFCGLVIPLELIACRERRNIKKKKYEEGDEIDLIINGEKNDIIKEYLIKSGLWNAYVMNYDNGFVDYNHLDDSLYVNKTFKYIEQITQYVNNGFINKEEYNIITINKELLEKEMIELFDEKGKEAAKEAMIPLECFKGTKILVNKMIETSLMNWLGTEKKWKLLFRASEHNYYACEFHFFCDYKGETVTLIKHKGHNNHINIFGGYTDQSWDCSDLYKPYSKEFLFTLINEHGIPPTKYDYTSCSGSNAIYCSSSCGPTFGNSDIYISNRCHSNACSYCSACSYDILNTLQKSSLFVNTNNGDSRNDFTVEDYEVWGRV